MYTHGYLCKTQHKILFSELNDVSTFLHRKNFNRKSPFELKTEIDTNHI